MERLKIVAEQMSLRSRQIRVLRERKAIYSSVENKKMREAMLKRLQIQTQTAKLELNDLRVKESQLLTALRELLK